MSSALIKLLESLQENCTDCKKEERVVAEYDLNEEELSLVTEMDEKKKKALEILELMKRIDVMRKLLFSKIELRLDLIGKSLSISEDRKRVEVKECVDKETGEQESKVE